MELWGWKQVMVLVDEMPMLAGDANDIKFSAIPMENIAIEILKLNFGVIWIFKWSNKY